ncbi:very short patch repair endonuclease [Burkholderia cepacia]|uniref:very short patch repair endonuclease n=1 Tax=Burkholderia cepacia TaxID=292 RepID=UPI00158C4DAE|nr:DNA mismatch endonuclease Vsr [Burkholderia cepacia]MDN7899122.1 DNA mismatch endonuclease Vsr [Burkholderia cepacia]
MTDVVDKETRSRMMSGIRAKNTTPELILRSALHSKGFRYRLHLSSLPGKPDMVFPKYHAVVFVHGCFWHAHDCKYFKLPRSRTEFWQRKLLKNRERDEMILTDTRALGWRVLVVWECATREFRAGESGGAFIETVAQWIVGKVPSAEIGIDGQLRTLVTSDDAAT